MERRQPFAWHLYLESKMIFSSTSTDFIRDLGAPNTYKLAKVDCIKFRDLFVESYKALIESTNSKVFNLSCMFLAARNFATCYSLSNQQPVFSRKSPFLIKEKLVLDENVFNILTRARLLSTRGYGDLVSHDEVHKVLKEATKIKEWMEYLIKVKYYE